MLFSSLSHSLLKTPFFNSLFLLQIHDHHHDQQDGRQRRKEKDKEAKSQTQALLGERGWFCTTRFKGLNALLLRQLINSYAQPWIRHAMESWIFDQDANLSLSLSHKVTTKFICLTTSHSLTRFLLSPLELLQARYTY
jgi:hypothetical protein